MQKRIDLIKDKAPDLQNVNNNEVAPVLRIFMPSVVLLFPGNSHDTSEGRKLIESIYAKNNNYLLIDRAYEDDKILDLVKDSGFCTIVSSKKNYKLPRFCDKPLYKQCNNIERYFLRLKRFR